MPCGMPPHVRKKESSEKLCILFLTEQAFLSPYPTTLTTRWMAGEPVDVSGMQCPDCSG